MYGVSEEYRRDIRGRSRRYEWRGTITTKAGQVYRFTSKDIVKGSGTLTRSCSGSTSLELGSVYAAELDISLFLDVDRYSMYEAEIDLEFVFQNRVPRRWDDLKSLTWDSIRSTIWNKQYEPETVPMGKFVISEATRTLTVLQLKAYDYMLKFDREMVNSGNTRTPYGWLEYACGICRVPLGVTEAEVAAMPNGTSRLSYTLVDDKPAYRDLIAHVAEVLCGVCQIDRLGRLVVIPFSNTPVMDIPVSWRYSSRIADYVTEYTGLYATYRAGGVTEYYKVEPDDGLVYNIGTNPLLQIAASAERGRILQGIISHLSATSYTPFEAEIPGDPSLDPMDVLSLSGGQAHGEIACITEIAYRIGGKSTIKCVGENPRLNQAKSRYTRNIEGLLAQNEGVEGTSTFWLSDAYSPEDMAISGEAAVVCATQFEIRTDKARGGIIWTGTFDLDEPGTVKADVYLDDKLLYSCRDHRAAGNATFTVSAPFETQRGEEGIHEIRITLSFLATGEQEVSVLQRELSALENRVRQIEKGFNNEIEAEDVVHAGLMPVIGSITAQAAAADIEPVSSGVEDTVGMEFTALFGQITERGEFE